MAINKNHPDYPVYIKKCKALTEYYDKEARKVRIYNRKMFDGPECQIHKKYCKELKKIQKEYAHLFQEE